MLRKKQIIIIGLFTIVITYLALYFQWAEFYEGYGYDNFNLFVSTIFLLTWLLFSFYWGKVQQKEYRRFIVVYWSINIITAIVNWAYPYKIFIQALLFPFYIWYCGPTYGFRYIFFPLMRLNIERPTFILITSPLGIAFSLIGYWLGGRALKLKNNGGKRL